MHDEFWLQTVQTKSVCPTWTLTPQSALAQSTSPRKHPYVSARCCLMSGFDRDSCRNACSLPQLASSSRHHQLPQTANTRCLRRSLLANPRMICLRNLTLKATRKIQRTLTARTVKHQQTLPRRVRLSTLPRGQCLFRHRPCCDLQRI